MTNRQMPTKDVIRDWMRAAHNEVEEKARAKQKAIWQSQLDDAAAEYIANKLSEWCAEDGSDDELSEEFKADVRAEIDEASDF